MGRLGVANVSIAAAFCIVYLLPPTRFLFGKFFTMPLAYSLGFATNNVLRVFVDYGLLAFVVYVALRAARVERVLSSPLIAQVAIAIGNAALVFAAVGDAVNFIHQTGSAPPGAAARRFARIAGWWLMCGGLAWLLTASIRRREDERQRVPVTILETVVALVIVGAPCAFVANLLWGKDGAMRRLAAMEARFAALCASAGERIVKPVGEAVDAVYFDPGDLISQYYRVQSDGTYSGRGWTGRIGERAVVTKQIQFYERNNEDRKATDPPYVRFAQGNFRNQPVQELQSRYAVRTRELLGPEETGIGMKGTEIRVIDLRANETLALSTSYVSTWHMRFCGRVEPDGNFTPAAFVGRALSLTLP